MGINCTNMIELISEISTILFTALEHRNLFIAYQMPLYVVVLLYIYDVPEVCLYNTENEM